MTSLNRSSQPPMPEISRFLGVTIRMYRDDHVPPHFHAIYGEFSAQVSINNPALLKGKLPARVLGYVIEWAELHEPELARCWEAAQSDQPLPKIAPLV
jgi:hypothetical protein